MSQVPSPVFCNTLQHTATHCNTLQYTATHCSTLQHTATHCNILHYQTQASHFKEMTRLHLVMQCVMTHAYVTWLIHVWRDSFTSDVTHAYVTWLIHMWHDSCIWDMTHTCVTWLIDMWCDSFISDVTHACVTWLIHMWRDSFIHDVTHSHVTWLIRMWHDSKHKKTSPVPCRGRGVLCAGEGGVMRGGSGEIWKVSLGLIGRITFVWRDSFIWVWWGQLRLRDVCECVDEGIATQCDVHCNILAHRSALQHTCNYVCVTCVNVWMNHVTLACHTCLSHLPVTLACHTCLWHLTLAVCCVTLACDTCRVLRCGAACCSALQTCCSVLQYVAVCCSVLQCVAVWCRVLQCVPVCHSWQANHPREWRGPNESRHSHLRTCGRQSMKNSPVLQCDAAYFVLFRSVAVCCV